MSTSWNAACLDHPLSMTMLVDDVQGSGDYGAVWISKVWGRRDQLIALRALCAEDDLLDLEIEVSNRKVDWRTLRWVLDHRDCTIELVNEYGDRAEPHGLKPKPPAHCSTCRCLPGQGRYEPVEKFMERTGPKPDAKLWAAVGCNDCRERVCKGHPAEQAMTLNYFALGRAEEIRDLFTFAEIEERRRTRGVKP